MKNYPYIHANAKRLGWSNTLTALLLLQAKADKAPGDSWTSSLCYKEDGQVPKWHTVSELRESTNMQAKALLAELEANLEQPAITA